MNDGLVFVRGLTNVITIDSLIVYEIKRKIETKNEAGNRESQIIKCENTRLFDLMQYNFCRLVNSNIHMLANTYLQRCLNI